MIIASAIVKVEPGTAEAVVEILDRIPKVATNGIHEDSVILLVEAVDAEELERLSKRILDEVPNVVAVFPTYFGRAEEPDEISP